MADMDILKLYKRPTYSIQAILQCIHFLVGYNGWAHRQNASELVYALVALKEQKGDAFRRCAHPLSPPISSLISDFLLWYVLIALLHCFPFTCFTTSNRLFFFFCILISFFDRHSSPWKWYHLPHFKEI